MSILCICQWATRTLRQAGSAIITGQRHAYGKVVIHDSNRICVAVIVMLMGQSVHTPCTEAEARLLDQLISMISGDAALYQALLEVNELNLDAMRSFVVPPQQLEFKAAVISSMENQSRNLAELSVDSDEFGIAVQETIRRIR